MERPRLGSMRRETTETMVRNIGREVLELRAALAHCRSDRVAEPKVTAALIPHCQESCPPGLTRPPGGPTDDHATAL